MIANLYKETLMDHYRNPRNRGTVDMPDIVSRLHNPSCGDAISWQATIRNGVIDTIAFEGVGCVISQATASLLSQQVKGLTLEMILTMQKDTILAMIGMDLGPTRVQCALLPLEVLHKGIKEWQSHQF